MAKLGSLLRDRKLKLMLIGESGTGKTCATMSIKGNIKVADFDNKAVSAAAFYEDTDPTVLERVDVEQFDTGDKVSAYKKFQEWLSEIEASPKKPDVITLDSVTLYSESLMAFVMNVVNKAEKRPNNISPVLRDYGVANALFKQDIGRLIALPCHVICVCHSADIKNEDGAVVGRRPLLSGQLVDYAPRIFREVWWTSKQRDKDGNISHVAISKSERLITATQIKNLPPVFPLNLQYAIDLMNKGVSK
jgi:hypothetical protein